MKKILFILTLSLLTTASYANINHTPQSNSKKLDTETPLPNFSIEKTETQRAITAYVDKTVENIKHDTELLEKNCGKGFINEQERNDFNTCFLKEKNQLSSDIFKISTALTLAFSNSKDERENIKKEFLSVYKKELLNMKNLAKEANIPPELFLQSLNGLFFDVAQDSYNASVALVDDNSKEAMEMEEYYASIVEEMNKIDIK